MTTAKQNLELAIEALHNANRLQQKAFAAYSGTFETAEVDPCYAIHNDIENVIASLEEILDIVAEFAN